MWCADWSKRAVCTKHQTRPYPHQETSPRSNPPAPLTGCARHVCHCKYNIVCLFTALSKPVGSARICRFPYPRTLTWLDHLLEKKLWEPISEKAAPWHVARSTLRQSLLVLCRSFHGLLQTPRHPREDAPDPQSEMMTGVQRNHVSADMGRKKTCICVFAVYLAI